MGWKIKYFINFLYGLFGGFEKGQVAPVNRLQHQYIAAGFRQFLLTLWRIAIFLQFVYRVKLNAILMSNCLKTKFKRITLNWEEIRSWKAKNISLFWVHVCWMAVTLIGVGSLENTQSVIKKCWCLCSLAGINNRLRLDPQMVMT